MPQDDDKKVFDVTRPSRVTPNATSRPIIVGHRAVADDPMMVGSDSDSTKSDAPAHETHADNGHPTPISVSSLDTPSPEGEHVSVNSLLSASVPTVDPEPVNEAPAAPVHESVAEDVPAAPETLEQETIEPPIAPVERAKHDSEHDLDPARHFTPVTTLIGDNSPDEDEASKSVPFVEELHPAAVRFSHNEGHADGSNLLGNAPFETPRGAGPKHPWGKIFGILFVVIILLAAAGYAAIDAGVINSSIKLPHHFFKQKTTLTTATKTAGSSSNSSSTPATPTTPTVPSGFVSTKLPDATISFAYPEAWGTPTETVDPGFSSRSATAKSDGTHAYLVSFATNKDVQLAFTSPKYLPKARATQYYDYLQWCTGSVDAKFYKETLLFSTISATDKPTTAVCNQGPLADGTKLDDSTLVQLKTKGEDGAALGDLYTMNLTNAVVSVMRVKDALSTNVTQIKQLLATVKTVSSDANSTSSSLPSSVTGR